MTYMHPLVQDDDIIIWLDLDDWFADNDAVDKIISKYNELDIWTTYGMYKCSNNDPTVNYGYSSDVIQLRNYRQVGWYWQHPRTFKGFLWKNINKNQFIDPYSNFMIYACDLVIGFAILEMCPPNKIFRFSDILVIYNRDAGNHEDLIDLQRQQNNDKYFRRLKKHKLLRRR